MAINFRVSPMECTFVAINLHISLSCLISYNGSIIFGGNLFSPNFYLANIAKIKSLAKLNRFIVYENTFSEARFSTLVLP